MMHKVALHDDHFVFGVWDGATLLTTHGLKSCLGWHANTTLWVHNSAFIFFLKGGVWAHLQSSLELSLDILCEV